eukprot:12390084-Prorocentrum_lima.AAC.1
MTSSLVGSEMCIRDRYIRTRKRMKAAAAAHEEAARRMREKEASRVREEADESLRRSAAPEEAL